ncbi:hypothetical protein ACNFNZ_00655 [Empedobacter brevis]
MIYFLNAELRVLPLRIFILQAMLFTQLEIFGEKFENLRSKLNFILIGMIIYPTVCIIFLISLFFRYGFFCTLIFSIPISLIVSQMLVQFYYYNKGIDFNMIVKAFLNYKPNKKANFKFDELALKKINDFESNKATFYYEQFDYNLTEILEKLKRNKFIENVDEIYLKQGLNNEEIEKLLNELNNITGIPMTKLSIIFIRSFKNGYRKISIKSIFTTKSFKKNNII